jgi:hypothetical protein
MRQQVRDLESCLQDKEEELLSCLCRSSERNQELLHHHVLLRMAELLPSVIPFVCVRYVEVAGLTLYHPLVLSDGGVRVPQLGAERLDLSLCS